MVVTLDTAPHAAWFVLWLLLLLLLFMMMMDRRVVDGTRVRQAKGVDGVDTNERHPPSGFTYHPKRRYLV